MLRRAETWSWLTPVAACVLTVMVAVNSASRHWPRLSAPDKANFFATLMVNGGISNTQEMFVLSKMDENVEWNVWSHPFPAQPASLLSVSPTNR